MKKVLLILLLSNVLTAQDIYDCELWGMTKYGGNGYGTVFSYSISRDTLAKRAAFTYAADGAWPNGSLMKTKNGTLYGLTWAGGTGFYNTTGGGCSGCGALIEFDQQFDSLLKRFDFDWDSGPGGMPGSAMIEANDGYLYGTTESGISTPEGAIFRYDPVNKTTTALHIMNYVGGHGPVGSLIQASDGNLYGMNGGGGLYNEGTLYKYDPNINTYIKLMDFQALVSGRGPIADLIQATNGLLYGLVPSGGQFGTGVLFSYDISNGTFTKLFDFGFSSGGYSPQGSLLQAANGKLYGLLSKGGTYSNGTLFEYDISSGTTTTKFNFTSNTGRFPLGSLMQASNGKLYGVTQLGTGGSGGALFEYDLVTDTVIKKVNFTTTTGYRPQNLRLLEICTLLRTESLSVSLPNIFTPNSDGINDDWTPLINYKNLLKDIEITIYNRWGNKVFATTEKDAGWNGNSLTGQPCAEGTYYYLVKYTNSDNKAFSQKGFLTLTR